MIGTVLRLLWRIFVGLVAIVLAYGTVFLFYPYIDNHLPLLFNFILLYIFVAYIGIPFIVRLWHFVLRPTHLPLYTVSGDGWSSDPINIAIVCKSEEQLRRIMANAGWNEADQSTFKNKWRFMYAYLFKRSYPSAPFSNLYLFGRPHDIGFQIQSGTPASPRHRHHVRFWQLQAVDDQPHDHTTFWDSILKLFTTNKRQIWIGAATHDIGAFALRVRDLKITHRINENTDIERDFLIATLKKANAIKRSEIVPAGNPISFRGQTFGVNIVTDGTLQVIELKNKR